jgi:polar amino acid transport system ATP-binding protein
MLKLEGVSKSFGTTKILDNIDLTLAPHTIVGLAGPSGSGKSTLLRLMQGLETPDTGRVVCTARRGFMFQDFQLFPHFSVWDNITYAPRYHGVKDYGGKATRLLEDLGLSSKINALPKSLSGGQKQRAALARSLMMSPEILLCDEPTSGLDVATISDVVTLLRSVRDAHVTMVIASHDLDFLIQLTDRIVVLRGGRIVADLSPGAHPDPLNALRKLYLP